MYTLWSIQTLEAYETLKREGVLRYSKDPEEESWIPAYHWLKEQMKQRLQGYSGESLLWAWHTPKPDLRHSAHLPRGTKRVRVTFQLPKTRVLLSDFDGWHFVLNRWFFSLSEQELDSWEESVGGFKVFEKLNESAQKEVTKSWDRVFDLTAPRDENLFGASMEIQATFAELFLNEVVKVDHFTAR